MKCDPTTAVEKETVGWDTSRNDIEEEVGNEHYSKGGK
jgi:hypothetical protein